MANATQSTEKRILCVGKVHTEFVSLKMGQAPRRVSEKDILTDAEMQAENDDYAADIADREWLRKGQW